MAGPGNESHALPITLHAKQDLLVFPTSESSLVCVGWSRTPVDKCPKHPNGSAFCRRFLQAKADGKGNKGDEPKPADAGLPLPPPNSQLKADHPTDDVCPAVTPQVVESQARTPLLPGDESTSELKSADAEPRVQPQSPSDAASGCGVDPQQRSGSRGLPQHRDHHDDKDRTSNPEHPRLFIPDDKGESVTCSLTLPDDESTGESESADAELNPADAEPCLQSQNRCDTASSRGHRGHRDDSDRTVAESDWPKSAADPQHRSQTPHSPASRPASSPGVETQQRPNPSVQDDGEEQNEGFVAPSRRQEIRMSQKTRDSGVKVALSRRYEHRRYSPPPATSASSVSATSAVIGIAVPMTGRTTLLVHVRTVATL
ncbi:hypothetical protein N0V88_000678 [Collariella sp. IMI 366227]|nr:hypothetical protein N0V88_000678 [Collariella sp. IMI 366227]